MMSSRKTINILKPPTEAFGLTHPADYIARFSSGHHSRRIFHRLPQFIDYDDFQKQSIEQFRRYLYKQGIDSSEDQATLLRFLYSASFNLQESAEHLLVYQQWCSSPSLQQLTPKAEKILQSGAMYTLSVDRLCRPVIYINTALTDFQKNTMEEYYCALNNLLKQVMEGLFVPGRVENWIIVVDTEGKLLLPLHLLESIVRRLSIVYCGCLERLYIVNTNALHKMSYNLFKKLIPQNTEKKIEVLDSKQLHRLQESIPPENLEAKYGGLLPNLKTYWPIQQATERSVLPSPTKSNPNLESTAVLSHEDSFYQSFSDDHSFLNGAEPMNSTKQVTCGCINDNSNSCSIF